MIAEDSREETLRPRVALAVDLAEVDLAGMASSSFFEGEDAAGLEAVREPDATFAAAAEVTLPDAPSRDRELAVVLRPVAPVLLAALVAEALAVLRVEVFLEALFAAVWLSVFLDAVFRPLAARPALLPDAGTDLGEEAGVCFEAVGFEEVGFEEVGFEAVFFRVVV